MRNLKLEIEYDGTNYCGWQAQNSPQLIVPSFVKASEGRHSPQKKSIQETIELTLQKILQEKVKLIAAGRTDAGVHAQAQVANFKTKSKIPEQKLRNALNALLPADIVISKAEDVPLGFHSRYAAKSKCYCYTILNRAYPSAFLRNKVYFYPYPLNLRLMRKEALTLKGRHNFSSFQGSLCKRNPLRVIKQIRIVKQGDLLYTYITGNSFLYRMARAIMGTLIEVGRGRFPPGSLKKILLARDRRVAGPTAAACGLCLMKVEY
ncbi:MAG: tRNA pseudouridine(38-40) synthase TruA [Candidatus Omnitrophota bacterium]